jgi:hypothetical protein
MGLVLVPSLHGYALCDKVIIKFAGNFGMGGYDKLTLKISSDQIWVAGYFGQPLTYPYFTIFSSDFLCNSLKS